MKHCFDLNLLQMFSFTGMSKNKDFACKPAFIKYQATMRLIFYVVHNADRSYTFIKNEEFLQNYFKYVRERSLKRRQSIDEDEIIRKKPKKRVRILDVTDSE